MVIGRTTALQLAFLYDKGLTTEISTDGKCDRRWRDEDSTLDNGITVICIVSYIYSADSLFLQTRRKTKSKGDEKMNRIKRARGTNSVMTGVFYLITVFFALLI